MTFALLQEKFHEKAKDVNITVPSLLNYVCGIFILDTGLRYNHLIAPLVADKVLTRILPKIRDGADRADLKKQSNLISKYNSIKEADEDLFETIGTISKNNQFDLSDEYDRDFNESFKQWIKNDPDINQILQALRNLNSMESEYLMLLRKFHETMDGTDKLDDSIRYEKSIAQSICDKILNEKKTDVVLKNVNEIVKLFKSIYKNQLGLTEKLSNVIKLQVESKSRRKIWAEVLIGMREKLKSNRKRVQPNAKQAKGPSKSRSLAGKR